jgi:hypothetical protein
VRCRIVSLEWGATGWLLLVAHFFKSSDDWNSFLTIEKKTTSFGFSCRSRNTTNGFAKNMHIAIGCGGGRIGGRVVAEEKEASTTTASIRQDKTGSICNHAQNHVAGAKTNCRIRVSRRIIKKKVAGLAGEHRGLGLIGCVGVGMLRWKELQECHVWSWCLGNDTCSIDNARGMGRCTSQPCHVHQMSCDLLKPHDQQF